MPDLFRSQDKSPPGRARVFLCSPRCVRSPYSTIFVPGRDQWRLVTFLAGWADILMLLLHFLLCLL
jgi:hypothetical protein